MKKIEALIVADSISEQGHRITSMLLTYPRFIHGEVLTHRMFSRNSASSRAIPFEKMVKMVEEDSFIPIAWQKDHKGMQGTEYVDELEASMLATDWLVAANNAIKHAKKLYNGTELSTGRILSGTTKQLCNRLLEPFMWHTVLVTATDFTGFFELRCPKYHTPVSGEGFYFKSKKDCIANHSNQDNIKKLEGFAFYDWQSINISQAEIHIQALAESMWDAMNESKPKELKAGEWHIPFGDRIDVELLGEVVGKNNFKSNLNNALPLSKALLKVATARCARLSYMTHEGEIDYEKDIRLHDQLLKNGHMSPFEHCARAMDEDEYKTFIRGRADTYQDGDSIAGFSDDSYGWCNNFRGWVQYRYLIENK